MFSFLTIPTKGLELDLISLSKIDGLYLLLQKKCCVGLCGALADTLELHINPWNGEPGGRHIPNSAHAFRVEKGWFTKESEEAMITKRKREVG